MATSADRPLLFLDVDGTVLPYGGVQLPSALEDWIQWQQPSNPQLVKVAPELGPRLLALPCDLMWATAWMHDANLVVAPHLGLPQLPVAVLPEAPEEDVADVLHWKTRALVGIAGGRPFAWVDDEISDLDRAWVTAQHAGSALLHRVDPEVGLTETDLVTLDRWLRERAGEV